MAASSHLAATSPLPWLISGVDKRTRVARSGAYSVSARLAPRTEDMPSSIGRG